MTITINGTTGVAGVDGSSGTPAIQGGDANTGIFFPAADTIAFTEGGVESMRIDSSGNVGIGTSSPSSKLHVDSTTSGQMARFNSTATNGGYITGYSSGTGVWDLGTAVQAFATGSSTDVGLTSRGSGFLGFGTNTTERMRITSSGNLLVGKTAADTTTAGSAILPAYGGANIPAMSLAGASSSNSQLGYHQYSTSAAAFRFYVGYGGTVYATSTTITGISDQRLKENIRDLDDGLEKVLSLKPRKFDWKEGKGADIKNARGFIAQEFEIVFPDMVEEWKDPAPEGEDPYKAVNANLIPTLVKAIQEQQALITQLQADVAALKGTP
jgi:hypothetical protein